MQRTPMERVAYQAVWISLAVIVAAGLYLFYKGFEAMGARIDANNIQHYKSCVERGGAITEGWLHLTCVGATRPPTSSRSD